MAPSEGEARVDIVEMGSIGVRVKPLTGHPKWETLAPSPFHPSQTLIVSP